MKIIFKKNWTQFIDVNSGSNNFVGRTREIENFKAYIINNQTGSILVSGVRGVGKTSFIYKLILEIKSYYKKNKIGFHPIFINAPQLNLENVNIKEELLKNIIRRLYSSMKNNNDKELSLLYKKASGKYLFKEDHSLSHQVLDSLSQEDTKELNTSFKLDNITNYIKSVLIIFGVSGLFISKMYG